MNHKKISFFLIAAGALAAVGIAFIFLFMIPIGAVSWRNALPEFAHLFWPCLIYLWLIGIAYLAALAEYFRVCHRIGNDRSFCAENAVSLGRIARSMGAAGALCLLAIPLVALQPQIPLSIWCIYPLLAAMASLALAVLAWALSKLLRRAVEIKQENDLTV